MSTAPPISSAPTATQAFTDAMRLPIRDVAAQLVEGLGVKMIAAMTNKKNEQTVSAWVTGTTKPHANTEERLRDILQIFLLIRTVDSVHTTRAWFVGKNPNLDYRAPALAIADGQIHDAFNAAETFVNS
ncbi:MAG: XRE family transcriptional regulator [Solirubrobacterales bacterium]